MVELSLNGISLVWDVLVSLIKGYETGKKDLFNSHIEPLHNRILAIHKDYMDGFEEAKSILENQDTPTSEIIKFLEQRRRDYLADRDLAQKLSEELSKAERRIVQDNVWTSVREYCQAVRNYFYATSEVGGISWYTDFLGAVKGKLKVGIKGADLWTPAGISGSPRRDLLIKIKSVLDTGLPNALSPINTYYAIFRRDLL